MDARRRDEVQLPRVLYRVYVSLKGIDDPIEKTNLKCQPIVSAVGGLTRVDFLDGQTIWGKVVYIQVDEVKG